MNPRAVMFINMARQAVEDDDIDSEILSLWIALEALGYGYPNIDPVVVFS